MTLTDNTRQHRHELAEDGKVAAHVADRLHGETIELVHTEVEPEYQVAGR